MRNRSRLRVPSPPGNTPSPLPKTSCGDPRRAVMLNRAAIFAAIDQQAAPGRDASFAVIALRVRGLREMAIRYGWKRGEQAEESAAEVIRTSLRPVDVVLRA